MMIASSVVLLTGANGGLGQALAADLVSRGAAKLYVTTGDEGRTATRAFCPDCGTPLWSTPAQAVAGAARKVMTIPERRERRPLFISI